jgi:hypothetical protein
MNPKPSVKPGTAPISPQIGSVDSLRWRGFRQSRPLLSLVESVLTDSLQLIVSARTINPFRSSSSLTNAPSRGTDLSLISLGTQSYSIQIEGLRKQLAFLMTDPNDT